MITQNAPSSTIVAVALMSGFALFVGVTCLIITFSYRNHPSFIMTQPLFSFLTAIAGCALNACVLVLTVGSYDSVDMTNEASIGWAVGRTWSLRLTTTFFACAFSLKIFRSYVFWERNSRWSDERLLAYLFLFCTLSLASLFTQTFVEKKGVVDSEFSISETVSFGFLWLLVFGSWCASMKVKKFGSIIHENSTKSSGVFLLSLTLIGGMAYVEKIPLWLKQVTIYVCINAVTVVAVCVATWTKLKSINLPASDLDVIPEPDAARRSSRRRRRRKHGKKRRFTGRTDASTSWRESVDEVVGNNDEDEKEELQVSVVPRQQKRSSVADFIDYSVDELARPPPPPPGMQQQRPPPPVPRQ